MTKILIIYTGGTIGMVNNPHTGALIPFDFEQIQQNVPELARLNYDLDVYSFNPILDSSNLFEIKRNQCARMRIVDHTNGTAGIDD